MPDLRAASRWFDKARNDLRTAELLLSATDYPADIVCFHAQQAAEKALKAALIALGVNPPFTHDLIRLVALLPHPTTKLLADATTLSPYAVASRYPDADEEYDDDLARLAAAASMRICELTEQLAGIQWIKPSATYEARHERDAVLDRVRKHITEGRVVPFGRDEFSGTAGEFRYEFEGEDDLLHLIVTRADGGRLSPEEGRAVAAFVLEGVPPAMVWIKPGEFSQHFYLGHELLLET